MNRNKGKAGGIDELAAVFAGLKSRDDVKRLFEELFTPAERSTFELRWSLLKSLHEGVPQREIAERLGVSLCKITRGSKILRDRDSIISRILNSPGDGSRK